MLNLPSVTLVTVATRDHESCKRAICRCQSLAKFAGLVVFTNEPEQYAGTVIKVAARPHEQWCVWRLTEFPRLCLGALTAGSHILFIESDSALVHPEAWTDRFLEYDYIGAKWADGSVGNGGFTLISARFLAALDSLKIPATPEDCFPCDIAMCREKSHYRKEHTFYRRRLEALGMRYADPETADQFSNELLPYLGGFGVHGPNYRQLCWAAL